MAEANKIIGTVTLTLKIKLEKPVDNIESLIAQRAYTIDGVSDVEVIFSERKIQND